MNPWNVSDMSASMEDALNMSEAERTERHRHNFMHVTTHTAQAWADTFVRSAGCKVSQVSFFCFSLSYWCPQ